MELERNDQYDIILQRHILVHGGPIKHMVYSRPALTVFDPFRAVQAAYSHVDSVSQQTSLISITDANVIKVPPV